MASIQNLTSAARGDWRAGVYRLVHTTGRRMLPRLCSNNYFCQNLICLRPRQVSSHSALQLLVSFTRRNQRDSAGDLCRFVPFALSDRHYNCSPLHFDSFHLEFRGGTLHTGVAADFGLTNSNRTAVHLCLFLRSPLLILISPFGSIEHDNRFDLTFCVCFVCPIGC